MKKIMFNDNYGLTKAVLEGRKTQTRREVTDKLFQKCRSNGFVEAGGFNNEWETKSIELLVKNSLYKIGEEVAVAQNYKDAGCDFYFHGGLAGWNNKMFVRSEEMPHRIRITNVRVERLQDISEEDCLKEGIFMDGADDSGGYPYHYYAIRKNYEPKDCFDTPREAFATLIDKVSGKGTWDSNPWVFVYDFELIK